ncbi:hypothetical protein B0H13DRAFT_1879073 [Mycena leptocephala]|nr:hypothetical protein B0H13DRAFT_1879073 [Mycena leptocephala]
MPTLDTNSTLGMTVPQASVVRVLTPVLPRRTYITGAFQTILANSNSWLCEVAHTVCIGVRLYHETVSDYGLPWNHTGMRLSGSFFVPCCTWILALLNMLSVAAVVYGSHRNLPMVSYQKQAAWVLYSTWVTSAVNDLVIAIMLVYGLHRQRYRNNLGPYICMPSGTLLLLPPMIFSVQVCDHEAKLSLDRGVHCRDKIILEFPVREAGQFIQTAVANSDFSSLNARTTLRSMNEITIPSSIPAIDLPVNPDNSKSLEKPPAVLPASASASRANFLRWQVQLWNRTTRQCTQGSEYHARDKVHLRNSILDFPYSSEIGPTNDAWVNWGARNPRQNSESTDFRDEDTGATEYRREEWEWDSCSPIISYESHQRGQQEWEWTSEQRDGINA